MQDFFTELDSDLRGADHVPTIVTPKAPERVSHTPMVADIPKPQVASSPITQKQTPRDTRTKHEPRYIHEKREPHEENISNFSETGIPPSLFPRTKPQSLPVLPKGQTRVMAIGGYNEIGKNMTAVQYADEIILIGGGVSFSEYPSLGAKYSLPDITPLIPLKRKIVGIIVTSGWFDQIAGLKHLLPTLGYPKVYGTRLTIGMVKREMEDAGMLQKVHFETINPETSGIIQISANMKIELFRQHGTMPDGVGVYIETPNAKLVHSGVFTFDAIVSSVNSPNFVKLRQIGARGIDLLMSDSAQSMQEGFGKTEAEIGIDIHDIIAKTTGRLIIATSSSLIGRIRQIIESAEKLGRTVFLDTRRLLENVNLSRELGYLWYHSQSVQRLTSKIDTTPENRQIILTTGSYTEIESWLSRMAQGEHPIVKIHPWDTILFSNTSSPGNPRETANLMNICIRLGATLFTRDTLDTRTIGHAAKEEQKIILNLVHPRNLLPAQGEFFMRVAHKKTATDLGFADRNIFLLDNGSLLDIGDRGVVTKNAFKLQTEEIIVDGNGIGIATSHVAQARTQMMQGGVMTLVFKADEKTKTLLGHLKLETRGFVYLDEVRELHKMIIKKARASYEDTMKDVPDIEEKDLIKIIRRDMEIFLQYRVGRNPVVIPMILYI